MHVIHGARKEVENIHSALSTPFSMIVHT